MREYKTRLIKTINQLYKLRASFKTLNLFLFRKIIKKFKKTLTNRF